MVYLVIKRLPFATKFFFLFSSWCICQTTLNDYTLFLLEQFYKNENLGFDKNFKDKLRTKPGLLSCRI